VVVRELGRSEPRPQAERQFSRTVNTEGRTLLRDEDSLELGFGISTPSTSAALVGG
jgi:hypothetical protein